MNVTVTCSNNYYTETLSSGLVHTTPEKFKCFPSTLHVRRKNLNKTATITNHFGFVFEKKLGQRNLMIVLRSWFPNSSIFKMFSVHAKTKKPAFSNSTDFKSASEKLCFRDGLVWTVGLTIEISCVLKFRRRRTDEISEKQRSNGQFNSKDTFFRNGKNAWPCCTRG